MRDTGLPDGASELERAVWTVLAAESERSQATFQSKLSFMVRWVDAHGRVLIRGAFIVGLLLLLGLLGWGVFHREEMRTDDIVVLERRARQASADGQHARAAALYGQAARRGREIYFRYRQAGEWMRMGQAAEAEAAYRQILMREPDAPNVRLNLALAVWQQGRREEAISLYRAFAAEQESYPELAARARLAVRLMERQVALDGE
jgi:tetratricopeptide (TPR) repeat protein